MRHASRRRGFTLTEMLVACSVFTVVLGLAVALLTLLLKLDGSARRHAESLATTARLARLWRADVHAALKVESAPKRVVLDLGSGESVAYECDRTWVRRTVMRSDAVVATNRFALTRPGVEMGTETVPAGTQVTLRLRQESDRSGGGTSAEMPVAVSAMLGTDHRFERGPQP